MPFWPHVHIRECLEEDEETDIPEGGEAAVVDGVEGGDLEPGERGSSEHLACVWVPQHVLERLPSGPIPSHRLDGSSSQLLDLLQLGVVPHGDLFV